MQGFKEKEFDEKIDFSIWRRLLKFARPYRRDLIAIIIAMAITAAADIALPLLTKYAIDTYIAGNSLQGLPGFMAVSYTHLTRQPNATQKKQADEILSLGCDIIFGSHPHMLQPIERRTVTNSDGSTREALVVWSLGNFLSDQRAQYKDTGMMVEVNLQKDMQTGAITIGEVGYTPTYVARTPRSDGLYNYRIVPSGQYDQDEIQMCIRDLQYPGGRGVYLLPGLHHRGRGHGGFHRGGGA